MDGAVVTDGPSHPLGPAIVGARYGLLDLDLPEPEQAVALFDSLDGLAAALRAATAVRTFHVEPGELVWDDSPRARRVTLRLIIAEAPGLATRCLTCLVQGESQDELHRAVERAHLREVA
jgi:hypothetical protein